MMGFAQEARRGRSTPHERVANWLGDTFSFSQSPGATMRRDERFRDRHVPAPVQSRPIPPPQTATPLPPMPDSAAYALKLALEEVAVAATVVHTRLGADDETRRGDPSARPCFEALLCHVASCCGGLPLQRPPAGGDTERGGAC